MVLLVKECFSISFSYDVKLQVSSKIKVMYFLCYITGSFSVILKESSKYLYSIKYERESEFDKKKYNCIQNHGTNLMRPKSSSGLKYAIGM